MKEDCIVTGRQWSLSNEAYLRKVTRYGWLLCQVPIIFRTYEVCLAAVTNHGGALDCVPLEFQTPEMCVAAITDQPLSIHFIKDEQFKRMLAALHNIDIQKEEK